MESLFIPETIAGGYSKTAWNPKQLLGFGDLRADIKMGSMVWMIK